MITRIDLRGLNLTDGSVDLRTLVPRAQFDVEAALEAVRPICEDVRHRGEAALIEYGERFDGVRLTSVRVAPEALARALAELDPQVRAALEESIRRARKVHMDQRRRDVRTQVVPGGSVTERWLPVDRVGLYVPGGLAVYPSSVVMNVIPAQIAGVGAIAVASPPQREFGGLPHPTILAACALLGVEEVYAVGGAQAVAMFAYGAGTGPTRCAPVDLVTGPGNIYVAAAKRLLKGRIGIDAEAGPTEIAILADLGASPAHVAADLISQAEHDPLAAAVLVTDSPALAEAVELQLEQQVAATKHHERIAAALSGRQSALILVDDLDAGLAVVNAYAAEHLEIQTSNARVIAGRVRNAGAVFVGPHSPVSLGDYAAGSNHVLPTGGCACHSSGLSVQTFLRGVHIVEYNEAALAEVAHHVVTLANAEDLPAHGQAVSIRFNPADPPAPVFELPADSAYPQSVQQPALERPAVEQPAAEGAEDEQPNDGAAPAERAVPADDGAVAQPSAEPEAPLQFIAPSEPARPPAPEDAAARPAGPDAQPGPSGQPGLSAYTGPGSLAERLADDRTPADPGRLSDRPLRPGGPSTIAGIEIPDPTELAQSPESFGFFNREGA